MEELKQLIDSSTKCMICLDLIKQATMCPNCFKYACEDCFKV